MQSGLAGRYPTRTLQGHFLPSPGKSISGVDSQRPPLRERVLDSDVGRPSQDNPIPPTVRAHDVQGEPSHDDAGPHQNHDASEALRLSVDGLLHQRAMPTVGGTFGEDAEVPTSTAAFLLEGAPCAQVRWAIPIVRLAGAAGGGQGDEEGGRGSGEEDDGAKRNWMDGVRRKRGDVEDGEGGLQRQVARIHLFWADRTTATANGDERDSANGDERDSANGDERDSLWATAPSCAGRHAGGATTDSIGS